MTTAATCETGAVTRSDVITCIPDLRAFAVLLAGDRQRADDLVRETIVQTFTAVSRPRAGISLKVRMFTALHRLHDGTLRQSIDEAARQPQPPSSKDDGVESDELLRIFRRLRDGDCQIDTIKSRVLEAMREISGMLREASPEKINFEILAGGAGAGPITRSAA